MAEPVDDLTLRLRLDSSELAAGVQRAQQQTAAAAASMRQSFVATDAAAKKTAGSFREVATSAAAMGTETNKSGKEGTASMAAMLRQVGLVAVAFQTIRAVTRDAADEIGTQLAPALAVANAEFLRTVKDGTDASDVVRGFGAVLVATTAIVADVAGRVASLFSMISAGGSQLVASLSYVGTQLASPFIDTQQAAEEAMTSGQAAVERFYSSAEKLAAGGGPLQSMVNALDKLDNKNKEAAKSVADEWSKTRAKEMAEIDALIEKNNSLNRFREAIKDPNFQKTNKEVEIEDTRKQQKKIADLRAFYDQEYQNKHDADRTAWNEKRYVEEEAAAAKAAQPWSQDMLDQEKNYQQSSLEQNAAYVADKAGAASSALSGLSVLMQSENKKQFQVGKAAAIGATIIDTYRAAQGAFAALAPIPFVGPALGGAAAAAAIVGGLFRVQQIQKTQFGGGAGGGGGPTGAPPGGGSSIGGSGASGANAQSIGSSNTNITLVGSTFQASQVRALIQQLNEQAGNNMNLRVQVSGST